MGIQKVHFLFHGICFWAWKVTRIMLAWAGPGTIVATKKGFTRQKLTSNFQSTDIYVEALPTHKNLLPSALLAA